MKPRAGQKGAYWFLRMLWETYAEHYERPIYTGTYFLIGLHTVHKDILLPFLRRMWTVGYILTLLIISVTMGGDMR
jgi:hypothetical protein